MRTLYKHADIVTESGILFSGFLLVNGTIIEEISADRPNGEFDEEIDLGGKVLCPGLINAHSHIPMTILRGVGCGLSLQDWLFKAVFPLEDQLNDEIVSAAVQLGLAEMIKGGTTAFADMYFFCDTIAKETVKAGVRANLSRSVCNFDQDETPVSEFPSVKEAVAFYEQFHGAGDGLISVDFSVHSTETCSEKFITGVAELAKKYQTGMQIHLSETIKENETCLEKWKRTPTELMRDCGVFDVPTLAAHCVHLTAEDAEILKRHDVSIAHCPSSNLKLGSGVAPIAQYLNQGLTVAVGTDGTASNNNLNMWEEMHLAALLPKGIYRDPTLLTSAEAFKMATGSGAKALRRKNLGTLKKGALADFVALDFEALHLIPRPDTLDHLIYSAQGSDVVMTVVNGKRLYEKGMLTTIDEEAMRFAVKQAEQKLFNK